MISIRESLTELERCHQSRQEAVECYLTAIRSMAQYPVDLNGEVTEAFVLHLNALVLEMTGTSEEALIESRATLRGLLRDYREQASKFLGDLHEELASNARALEDIMATLAQADGDQAPRLRAALARLREAVRMPDGHESRALVAATADAIDKSLEELRHHHQLTITQFQAEVRMLHRRIDSLETAAAIDNLTKLFNRGEMESRIGDMKLEWCLLLIRMTGLRVAENAFQPKVAIELAGAFTKRLRNTLPPAATLGRWGHEEFLAIVPSKKAEALGTARWIAEHLSGSYACMQDGKAVRPSLQLSVSVVENTGEPAERMIERVTDFFGA